MKPTMWFAGIYILSCVGSLAVAFGINVLGNTTGLFPSSLFPARSERAWKTRRLDEAVRDCRPPQVIILGSSRVMQIQPKYVQAITGKTTFNYGVSTATPTDYLTQLRYLLHIGCRPEIVVLGLDEFAFHYRYKPWEIETLGHFGLFREMPFPENLDVLVRTLGRIDLGTTRLSLSRIVRRKRSVTRSIEDVGDILLDDGYLIYANDVRKMEAGTFNQAANISADIANNEGIFCILQESLLCPNPRKLDRFDEFLSLSKANGIEVRVMFMPLHPDFERQRFTEQLSQARSALNQDLQRICRKYGALYRDFTKLASYDGDPKEFYDAERQTHRNTRKMLNVLFGIKAGDIMVDLPTDSDILKHLPPVTTLTTD